MKKLFLFLFTFLVATTIYPQFKGAPKSGAFAGIGYSFILYTNSDVSNIYPAFEFRTNSLNSEFNPFLGYKFSDAVSLEFSPSIIYSKSGGTKGFYFKAANSPTYFYQPSPAYLFSIPINAKLKLFPFSNSNSIVSKGLYFGISGGPMYIREEYDNYIYYDENTLNILNIRNVRNSMWTFNTLLSIGYSTNQQFNYGFEIGYRFVPLPLNREYPLISSIASNMNAVILNVKIGFGF